MIDIGDLVTPDRIFLDLRAGSKRQLFQDLATAVERTGGIDHGTVLAALIQREKLGTTGIGDGIAVPHARLAGLQTILGFFARLARPVDYDALDDEPVDLVFLIVAPEAGNADQLKALARIARLLRDPTTAARLRSESDQDSVYGVLRGRADEPA
jgi:nitrogen PTS system EIIA component